MIPGMLTSAALAVFGLLVALGRIGHPIDDQAVSPFGWSIMTIGLALFVLFAVRFYQGTGAGRSAKGA